MSFTPDDQQIGHHISASLNGLCGLRVALCNRIADHERWSAEHLDECVTLVGKLTELEWALRKL